MKKFPTSTLLFVDTGSFAYEVVGHDLYAGIAEIKDEFDFSEYPRDHFLQSYDNMKIVGNFKDGCKGQLMLRFVRLRHMRYSFECKHGVEMEVDKPTSTSVTSIVPDNKVTAKGGKASVAKKLSFGNYECCLSSLSSKRAAPHKVFTYSTEKIGLSAFDTKKWIYDDGNSTNAFGHWKTEL